MTNNPVNCEPKNGAAGLKSEGGTAISVQNCLKAVGKWYIS